MKRFLAVVMAVVLLIGAVLPSAEQVSAYTVPENMQWWANDHFGMFIHLGAYSAYGHGEWAMSVEEIPKKKYQETIASKFNPVNFDAKSIVDYAKRAGMKYIVITAKHHEGLAMWDTQVESFKDYTGTKMFSLQQYTPFKETNRDILMELKNACDEAGLKFGLYYSIIDWNHSSQKIGNNFTTMSSMKDRKAYIKDMKDQLQELVARYNPAVMWFDGDWTNNKGKPTLTSWWTKADGKDLYNYMKAISPQIIVNERVCRKFNLGDFECPEQEVPKEALSRPWETCQTMNDAWGYKESSEDAYRSTEEIIQELVTVVSREGNYLLNIGPKGDGTITEKSAEILDGMAEWMEKNSGSIYGAVRSPFKKDPSWGTYTRKGNTVYAHVFQWQKKGTLTVSQYKSKKLKLKRAYLQNGDGTELAYTIKNKKIILQTGKKAVDKADTVIVMEYEPK